MGSQDGPGAFRRRGRRALSLPREDRATTWPPASQEQGPRQAPHLLAPRSCTFQPPGLRKTNTSCLSHPVSGILLQQPEEV